MPVSAVPVSAIANKCGFHIGLCSLMQEVHVEIRAVRMTEWQRVHVPFGLKTHSDCEERWDAPCWRRMALRGRAFVLPCEPAIAGSHCRAGYGRRRSLPHCYGGMPGTHTGPVFPHGTEYMFPSRLRGVRAGSTFRGACVATVALHQAFRYAMMRRQVRTVRGRRHGRCSRVRAGSFSAGCSPASGSLPAREGTEKNFATAPGTRSPFRLSAASVRWERMAIVAADAVGGVGGMIELRLLFARVMALQTALGVAFSDCPSEREDELGGCRCLCVIAVCGLFRVRVRLTCAMAHFAADDGILMFRQCGVRGLAEFLELRLVAGAAGFSPDIAACWPGGRLKRQ